MKTIAKYFVTILLLATATAVLADMQSEIQHLLQYVENSGCEFERNGTVYNSKEARSHIERKYGYVKSRVDETEDFIKYAATESSISGRNYHVTCNSNKQLSAEWLQHELTWYRNKPSDTTALDSLQTEF